MRLAGVAVWLVLLVASATASTTFDRLRSISEHAQRTSDDLLREGLQLACGILQQHALDSPPLQLHLQQLRTVLQQDCCDYFTALPLTRGLTNSLHEVLELQLPPTVLPVVRRSYVAAMWLLQRSKQFRWNTKYLDKALAQGLYRLYEAHVDVSAGRPISYHHISKSGGTSMCQLARQNACSGPVMTKSNNCILDTGVDGPVWVFRHDSLAANHIPLPSPPAPPPPPPPPRPPRPPRVKGQKRRAPAAGGDPFDLYDADANNGDDDDDDVFDAVQSQHDDDAAADDMFPRPSPRPPVPVATFEWFMYGCPALVAGKSGYGCEARQEAAAAKSATFFANEHTLSVAHGKPQVCAAFTNVVVVRDALGEAISLMGEVGQVYTRLLRRQSVISWTPPRSDLAWWRRWAPAVVSSYASRTLLGSTAFCPPDKQPAPDDAPGVDQAMAGSGGAAAAAAAGGGGPQLPLLGEAQVTEALRALASFDVVLDLGRQELMDTSLAKLLGWTAAAFSSSQPHRSTVPARVLSWEELWEFARQQPRQPSLDDDGPSPPPPPPAAGSRRKKGSFAVLEPLLEPGSESRSELDPGHARLMLGEAAVRRVFAQHGVAYVAWPLQRNNPPPPLPSRVIAAAGAALKAVNDSRVTVLGFRDGHVVVQLQEPAAGPSGAAGREGPAAGGVQLYHIWPVHGFVLDEQQYKQLLEATEADRQLYRHAQLLQLLDAAWLSALGRQRPYIKLLRELVADVDGCGLAGLSRAQ